MCTFAARARFDVRGVRIGTVEVNFQEYAKQSLRRLIEFNTIGVTISIPGIDHE